MTSTMIIIMKNKKHKATSPHHNHNGPELDHVFPYNNDLGPPEILSVVMYFNTTYKV